VRETTVCGGGGGGAADWALATVAAPATTIRAARDT
jgi:hypothetical protein